MLCHGAVAECCIRVIMGAGMVNFHSLQHGVCSMLSPSKPCSLISCRARGYGLLELMITLAVIGVLAALAYPSYADYIKRGHRAQARTALAELSHVLERQRIVNHCYTTGPVGACSAAAPSMPVEPVMCQPLS